MEEEEYDTFAACDDNDADDIQHEGSDDETDCIAGGNHAHLDHAFDMNDDMKYCRLQENLYQSTMVKLLHFRQKTKLSRTSGKELITLLRAVNPSLSIVRFKRYLE